MFAFPSTIHDVLKMMLRSVTNSKSWLSSFQNLRIIEEYFKVHFDLCIILIKKSVYLLGQESVGMLREQYNCRIKWMNEWMNEWMNKNEWIHILVIEE